MCMYIYNHIKQSIIGEYEMVNIRDILEILTMGNKLSDLK